LRRSFITLLGTLVLFGFPANASAKPSNEIRIPPGYSVTGTHRLTRGLTHLSLAGVDPPESVNVAVLAADNGLELRTVVSNDAIAEQGPRLERTSSMCVRIRCLVAVNADFYAAAGQPVGGVVSGGELVRSPNKVHHQLLIAPGRVPADDTAFGWKGTLVPTDLKQIDFDGVNVDRNANQLILYTPSFGSSTQTNPFGVELTLEIEQPAGSLKLSRTALVRLTGLRAAAGDTPIPAEGAVLSGHGTGAQTLLDLWTRVTTGATSAEGLLRLETTPELSESVGGTPILVRDGRRWFTEENKSFYRGRHPRTIVGWNRRGDVYLVTVDGRQPGVSAGMTLGEAAQFMIDLGATDALNLDGGGSTTFVMRGEVANRPSDRAVQRNGAVEVVRMPGAGEHVVGYVERPVSVALAIVATTTRANGLDDPFAAGPIGLPSQDGMHGRTPATTDPASSLDGTSPAVVTPMGVGAPASTHDGAVGFAMLALTALGAVMVRRRMLPGPR
jgi:hypothetical protein